MNNSSTELQKSGSIIQNTTISYTHLKNQKKNLKGNATKPLSVYSKRSDDDVFYLNKAFSDYFKQDFKEFAEKFSLLHPKVKCNNNKMKRILEKLKTFNEKNEKISQMKEDKVEKEIEMKEKDIYLAGNSKNIFPLLRSIYSQLYPYENEENVLTTPNLKYYFKSNKPLGNNDGNINYTYNMRNLNMQRNIIKTMNLNDMKYQINPEMYEEDDPDIKLFNNIKTDELDDLVNIKTNEENVINNNKNSTLNITEKYKINIESTDNKNTKIRPKTARIQTPNITKRNKNEENSKSKEKNKNKRELKRFNSKKGLRHGITNINIYNNNNDDFIHNKRLPFKDKPSAHPIQYQKMMNKIKMNYSNNITNNLFEDIILIENVHKKVKDDFSLFKDVNQQRPSTSKDFLVRPLSKLDKIRGNNIIYNNIEIKETKDFSHNIQTVASTKKLSSNNFFNDYIDSQFRTMYGNRNIFLNKKEDFRNEQINKNKELSGLLQVKNLKE
jgi:hypothetical protein